MNYQPRILTILLLALTFFSSAAHAQSNPIIDDLGIVDLRVGTSSVTYNYNYPGLNGPGGFDAPDCLMFVSSGVVFQLPDDALQQLAAGLKLTDGAGNMFPGG